MIITVVGDLDPRILW